MHVETLHLLCTLTFALLHFLRGATDGREFRDSGSRLATACQLGSDAEIPVGTRAGAHEGAWARRHAVHVRRERSVPDRHADSGMEPAEAGPALRDALRRRSAGAVRAGGSRLPD